MEKVDNMAIENIVSNSGVDEHLGDYVPQNYNAQGKTIGSSHHTE